MSTNLPTGLPGLDRAIATLHHNGYTVERSLRGGWTLVNPNATTLKRREGVTHFEVIAEADGLQTKDLAATTEGNRED